MSDLFGQTVTIKALSLWQPWAALMGAGVKIDETRHWSTDYRGLCAIHAAKTCDVAGAPEALCIAALGPFWRKTVALGAVVAIGELAGCRDAARGLDGLTAANAAAGNFAPGRFAWRFERIRALTHPILTVGRQGLFNWEPPADLAERLGPLLNHDAACRYIGWA